MKDRKGSLTAIQKTAIVFVFLLVLILASTASAPNAFAAEQNLGKLRQEAAAWLRNQPVPLGGDRHVSVQSPDSRLRLPACGDLKFSQLTPEHTVGRISIRVRCPSPHWQVFLSAKISVEVPTVIATHALMAGQQLSKNDVALAKRPLESLPPGSVSRLSQVLGEVVRTSVPTGMPVTIMSVESQVLVRQGQQVTITAAGDGVNISVAGVAMENGRQGQRILVKNAESGRIIKATVTAANTVSAPF